MVVCNFHVISMFVLTWLSIQVTTVKKAAESDIACKVLRENESILFDINSLGTAAQKESSLAFAEWSN